KLKKGIAASVPVPGEPIQLPMAPTLFVGMTCDANPHETAHRHPLQWEIYFVIRGTLRMLTWRGTERQELLASAGDIILVPPGTCHLVAEWPVPGICYVARAPNDIV